MAAVRHLPTRAKSMNVMSDSMVSVIIPTFNKLPRLKLALHSFINQTYDKNKFEVIVVNDGSLDGTKEYLDHTVFPFELKTISTENSGRSAARNKGIVQAEGAILIFTDDDLILSPNFIEMHVKSQHLTNKCVHGRILDIVSLTFFEDPTLGVFFEGVNKNKSNAILSRRCITQEDIGNRFDRKIGVNKHCSFMEETIQKVLKSSVSRYDWIGMTGGNFCCPREWIVQVGLFDENMGRSWGCEDFELGYRLARKHEFHYADDCLNYHMSHYRKNMEDQLVRSFAYFYKKHNDINIWKMYQYLSRKISFGDLV